MSTTSILDIELVVGSATRQIMYHKCRYLRIELSKIFIKKLDFWSIVTPKLRKNLIYLPFSVTDPQILILAKTLRIRNTDFHVFFYGHIRYAERFPE
jgi:hypothetical protein